MMRTILLAVLAAGAALTVSVPADARQGCGVGAHRGPGGYCRPNRGRVVVAPRVVVGRYYQGRGYWDGRRYWGQRYRWHGGWRYR
jgi:hypothetical protein